MVDRVMAQAPGTRLVVLAPVVRGRKGEYKKLFFDLGRQGFTRVRVNGAATEVGEGMERGRKRKSALGGTVVRLVVRDNLGARLADSLETALRLADGVVLVEVMGEWRGGSPPLPTVPMLFSERLACAECGVSLPEVSPRMFSFNNPYGACPECGGLGSRDEIDPERLVPNPRRSLKEGALAPWAGRETTYFRQTLQVLAKRHRFSLDSPWEKLRKPVRDVILHGERDGGFEGVVATLERRYRETTSEEARTEIQQFMAERPCPACGGARLRRESLGFKIGGRSIADVVTLTIKGAAVFFDALTLTERETAIARRVLKEIRERLGFLMNVGLDYLTLDRPAGTLSGGEDSGSASRHRSGPVSSECCTSSTSRRLDCTSETTGACSRRSSGSGTSATRCSSSSTTRRRSSTPTTSWTSAPARASWAATSSRSDSRTRSGRTRARSRGATWRAPSRSRCRRPGGRGAVTPSRSTTRVSTTSRGCRCGSRSRRSRA